MAYVPVPKDLWAVFLSLPKPDYGKGEKSPPELSSPRCAGCPYKGQSPCVGYCLKQVQEKKKTEPEH